MEILVVCLILYAVMKVFVKKSVNPKAEAHSANSKDGSSGSLAQSSAASKAASARPIRSPHPAFDFSAPEGESLASAPSHRAQLSASKAKEYQGSLNAESHEGEDLCDASLGHQRIQPRLSSLSAEAAQGNPIAALERQWSGDEIVRGVIMSEVLKHPWERKWGIK